MVVLFYPIVIVAVGAIATKLSILDYVQCIITIGLNVACTKSEFIVSPSTSNIIYYSNCNGWHHTFNNSYFTYDCHCSLFECWLMINKYCTMMINLSQNGKTYFHSKNVSKTEKYLIFLKKQSSTAGCSISPQHGYFVGRCSMVIT